jgi:3-phenylpropionate/trans-cinnamate dioxygenase ferredoxin reductase subunit
MTSTTLNSVVVVGGGVAGANAALELRRLGFEGKVTLLCAEAHLPYQRPPLSKSFLQGRASFDDAIVAPRTEYDRLGIDLQLGRRATQLDVERRFVHTDAGEALAYDQVVVATGGRKRRLAFAGSDLDGVFDLRSVDDSERIRDAAKAGLRAVVIGMGFIGCEVTASLRIRGLQVTAVESGPAPLLRVLGPEVAAVIADLHRSHGVELLTGDAVDRVEGGSSVDRAVMKSGRAVDCDLVVAGIGIEPEVDLLARAGARISNGVDVDERCRTSLPSVFAAGDIANHLHPVFGRIRVEHFNNAEKQGRAAAAAVLDGDSIYSYIHSFWSDQFDQTLEYIGHAGAWDRVTVEGSLDALDFIVRYHNQGRLLAAAAIGRGGDPESAAGGELKEIGEEIGRQPLPH